MTRLKDHTHRYYIVAYTLVMKPVLPIILSAWLIGFVPATVWGQCAPALPSCASCTPLTASNQNIGSGTYCVTTSISNLNLSGSAVICVSGAGGLNGGNINGGTVIYNGSTATNPLGININGGTLRIRSSITLGNLSSINASSTLIVENGATLTVNNLDVNGRLVVDQGSTLYVNGNFGINGGGAVCFNNGIVNTGNFTKNDQLNSTTTTSKGCYAVRSSVSSFNQNLTSTSSVYACLPGATPTPNRFGSATVNPNCSNLSPGGGCLAALPVRLISFQARLSDEGVQLSWASSLEQDFSYYQVERSTNAIGFEATSPRIAGLAEETGNRQYTWTDMNVRSGTFYYRLKQVDVANTHSYSKIIGVTIVDNDATLKVSPNPFTDALQLTLTTPINGAYVVELYAASGKRYLSATGDKSEPVATQTISTDALAAGVYFASVRIGDQHFVRRVIKP